MEKDWIVVYTVNKPYRAEMIKEILEKNNIKCVVMNKRDSALKAFGKIEIYVHQNDKDNARELLKDFED